MRRALFALLLLLASLGCTAQDDGGYTVIRVEAAKLRLFWRDDRGQPLRRLNGLRQA